MGNDVRWPDAPGGHFDEAPDPHGRWPSILKPRFPTIFFRPRGMRKDGLRRKREGEGGCVQPSHRHRSWRRLSLKWRVETQLTGHGELLVDPQGARSGKLQVGG